jgi:hypothetical protein
MRQTADIFPDDNSNSSAGSDSAPSEDNMNIEEIEKVLPVAEDPDLAMKFKQASILNEQNKKELEA